MKKGYFLWLIIALLGFCLLTYLMVQGWIPSFIPTRWS